jgi:hypothetical protein
MQQSSWGKIETYGIDKVYGGEGAPTHEEYMDKLQDPRWHAFTDLVKRRRVTCQKCDDSMHLQVHHIRYLPGLEPWEYPLSEVLLLCVECHESIHHIKPTQVALKSVEFLNAPLPAPANAISRRASIPLSLVALMEVIDQVVSVEGTVDEIRSSRNGSIYISMGGKYPRAVLTIVIFSNCISGFGNLGKLVGKKIRVNGPIHDYRGSFQLVANIANQLETIYSD